MVSLIMKTQYERGYEMSNVDNNTDGIPYITLKSKPNQCLASLDSIIQASKWAIDYTILGQEIVDKYKLSYLEDGIRNNNPVFAYNYKKGIYVQMTDELFGKIVIDMIPSSMYNSTVKNNALSAVRSLIKRVVVMNNNENIINFKNGVLKLDTMELVPHSPEFMTTVQIDCNWNPDAKPVNGSFDKFMEDFCNKDIQPDMFEDTKEMLMQFFGLAISNVRGYRIKKGLFIVGAGNTGKTQLKSLCERIVGFEYVINLDLQALESRWGTGNCFNKRIVGSNDQSFAGVKELTKFKQITGGDALFAEHKGKDGFTFVFNGVVWMCGNAMPTFSGDKGRHLYERLMIYEPLKVIPQEERDKYLIDKMLTEKEYVVKCAVEALKRLISNDFVLKETDVMLIKRIEHERDNDTMMSFMDECCCEPDDENLMISTRSFYDLYKNWCIDNNNGYVDIGKKAFKKRLEDMGKGDIRRTNKGRYYTSITVKSDAISDYANSKIVVEFYNNKGTEIN